MFGHLQLCAALVALFSSNAIAAENGHTPLPLCKIKSSNVNECLKTFLQKAIKNSHQGSKEYSIPPLDPYFVPKIAMASSKNMGVNIVMINSTTNGFSKATVTKVKADPMKGYFEIHYIVPVSTILSHYNLNGKIFNMPINGEGNANITFCDMINQMMNENWKDIFARLQPKLEEDMSKHTYKLMSDFSRTVSYDQLFPDA